jgi:toxin ParE1/3/4
MRLKVHRLAAEEIVREIDYYDGRDPGVGAQLEHEIRATFERILAFPEAAEPWRDRVDLRVAVLDRFPFTMPYQLVDDMAFVFALAHARRRAGYWSRRKPPDR